MIPTWRERLNARICDWFGHRTTDDGYTIACRRCRRLLAGPLNRNEYLGATPAPEAHEGEGGEG